MATLVLCNSKKWCILKDTTREQIIILSLLSNNIIGVLVYSEVFTNNLQSRNAIRKFMNISDLYDLVFPDGKKFSNMYCNCCGTSIYETSKIVCDCHNSIPRISAAIGTKCSNCNSIFNRKIFLQCQICNIDYINLMSPITFNKIKDVNNIDNIIKNKYDLLMGSIQNNKTFYNKIKRILYCPTCGTINNCNNVDPRGEICEQIRFRNLVDIIHGPLTDKGLEYIDLLSLPCLTLPEYKFIAEYKM